MLSVPLLLSKSNVCGEETTLPRIQNPCLEELLDGNSSCGKVDKGLCVMSVTRVAKTPRRNKMSSLSYVVNQSPMLRVSAEILLAFCCATPLLLLLCFLV
jgi:hypothetical protein